MRIDRNTTVFDAYRTLSTERPELDKSLEELSSGRPTSRTSRQAEMSRIHQAARSAQDGVSFVHAADAALDAVHAILRRMREVAISAADGPTAEGLLRHAELVRLRSEINRIAANGTFAGHDIFQDYGTVGALMFQAGADPSEALSVSQDLGLAADNVFGVDLTGLDVTTATGDVDVAIDLIDRAVDAASTIQATLRATRDRLEDAVADLSVAGENLRAYESRLLNSDMAEEMVAVASHQIIVRASTAIRVQANQTPDTVESLIQ